MIKGFIILASLKMEVIILNELILGLPWVSSN